MTRPLLPRTGIGYDVHRFQVGRRLVLGGVEIAHTHGLEGHSDADVLLHAVADALLGAVALGDIGQHFPPNEPRWRDMNSRDIVTKAVALAREAGYGPVNIDVTVIAEAPKILPHAPVIRATVAAMMGLDVGDVSIKATTNEQMGFVGRREGIAAFAVATMAPLAAFSEG